MKLINVLALVALVSACSTANLVNQKPSEKPQLCGSDLVGCQVK